MSKSQHESARTEFNQFHRNDDFESAERPEPSRENFLPSSDSQEFEWLEENCRNAGNQERERFTARAVAVAVAYYYYCNVTVRNVRSCLADTNVTVRNVASLEVVR